MRRVRNIYACMVECFTEPSNCKDIAGNAWPEVWSVLWSESRVSSRGPGSPIPADNFPTESHTCPSPGPTRDRPLAWGKLFAMIRNPGLQFIITQLTRADFKFKVQGPTRTQYPTRNVTQRSEGGHSHPSKLSIIWKAKAARRNKIEVLCLSHPSQCCCAALAAWAAGPGAASVARHSAVTL